MQTRKKGKMSTDIDVKIEFSGLKSGVYKYNFLLNKLFFSRFKNESLQDGEVAFEVTMQKSERLLVFDFSFLGCISSVCDRCLKPLEIPVSGNETLYVKFSNTEISEDENIVVLSENEYQIDLSQIMYEYVVTVLPMRHIHPDDYNGMSTCDRDMMGLLQKMQEKNEKDKEITIDPRWEKLKELKIKK